MRESLRFVMELEVSLLLFRIDIVCFFAKIVIICINIRFLPQIRNYAPNMIQKRK